MKIIKTDNEQVDIFLSHCASDPSSVAVGLMKQPEGNMHILFYITEADVAEFLGEHQ